jgi:hypothetical protein
MIHWGTFYERLLEKTRARRVKAKVSVKPAASLSKGKIVQLAPLWELDDAEVQQTTEDVLHPSAVTARRMHNDPSPKPGKAVHGVFPSIDITRA